jgi:hypothetical protein
VAPAVDNDLEILELPAPMEARTEQEDRGAAANRQKARNGGLELDC